jgi:hypothetical protein
VFIESLLEGYMSKMGGRVGTVYRRYFIMFSNKLMYFHNSDAHKALGEIKLCGDTACNMEPCTTAQSMWSITRYAYAVCVCHVFQYHIYPRS